MKIQSTNFLVGIFLVLVGAFLLMISLGKIYLQEEYVVATVFASAGIVFILAHMLFQRKLWTLIVGAICLFIGSAIFIDESRMISSDSIGVLFFIITALLFFNALRKGKKNWWAIIPGGFSLILAIHILIDMNRYISDDYHGVIFLGGSGVIFGIIYLLRDETFKLDWAKYPSIILLILAALVLFAVDMGALLSRLILPVLLILIGSYVVYGALKKQKQAAEEVQPTEKSSTGKKK